MKAVAVATPEPFVTAVLVSDAPNLPEAAEPGAVNVTVAPTTGLFEISSTVACSSTPKLVLITALCVAPAEAVMLFGALFVRLKLAVDATPATAAVTV